MLPPYYYIVSTMERNLSDTIHATRYQCICGELILAAFDGRLCMCDWTSSKRHEHNITMLKKELNAETYECSDLIISAAITELNEYFQGVRQTFDIPLYITGTEFQRRVRHELVNIPYSDTISYSELAVRLCIPKGIRSVASAVAGNPLSIFLPCHRVIGSDGTLKGYAGGLNNKSKLLELEKRYSSTNR